MLSLIWVRANRTKSPSRKCHQLGDGFKGLYEPPRLEQFGAMMLFNFFQAVDQWSFKKYQEVKNRNDILSGPQLPEFDCFVLKINTQTQIRLELVQ